MLDQLTEKEIVQRVVARLNDMDIVFAVQYPYETGGSEEHNGIINAKFHIFYDPTEIPNIIAHIGEPRRILLIFPDDIEYSFIGDIQSFEPSVMMEGEMPMATVRITIFNKDML